MPVILWGHRNRKHYLWPFFLPVLSKFKEEQLSSASLREMGGEACLHYVCSGKCTAALVQIHVVWQHHRFKQTTSKTNLEIKAGHRSVSFPNLRVWSHTHHTWDHWLLLLVPSFMKAKFSAAALGATLGNTTVKNHGSPNHCTQKAFHLNCHQSVTAGRWEQQVLRLLST